MIFDELVKGLDTRKYDSVAVFPRGGSFPESRRYPGGFSHSDEDELREMAKSGNYSEVLYYKNGLLKGSVRLNSAVRSTNAVVANALAATMPNASGHKVKVTVKSITDKGLQTFEKLIDVDNLEGWMRSAGLGGEYQSTLKRLATMGVESVHLSCPCRITIADV